MIHQFDLARLVDVTWQYRRATRIVAERSECDLSHAPAALTRHGRSRPGRREETGLRQGGRVSEAGRVADPHANPGTAISTRTQLFDTALVQHRRGRRTVLDEDLGALTAAGHRFAQRSLEDVMVNQCRIHSRERTREKWCRNVTSGPRK